MQALWKSYICMHHQITAAPSVQCEVCELNFNLVLFFFRHQLIQQVYLTICLLQSNSKQSYLLLLLLGTCDCCSPLLKCALFSSLGRSLTIAYRKTEGNAYITQSQNLNNSDSKEYLMSRCIEKCLKEGMKYMWYPNVVHRQLSQHKSRKEFMSYNPKPGK